MPWRSSQENEATQYPNDILLAGNHHHKNEKKKDNKNTKTTATNMTKQDIFPIKSQFYPILDLNKLHLQQLDVPVPK